MAKVVIAAAAERDAGTLLGRAMALMTAALMLMGSNLAHGAGSDSAKATAPVKLESVPGTSVKRVTLTAKAAARLGIATGAVREELVERKQMAGGQVVTAAPKLAPMAGLVGKEISTFIAATPAAAVATTPAPSTGSPSDQPADGEAWVMVSLSPGEFSRLALDRPARVLPLSEKAGASDGVMAMPSKLPPVVDPKRSMLMLRYVVNGANHGLTHLQRARVELELSDSGLRRKVAPTSAVFYDAQGGAWVYVNTAPLTYVRQPVGIERIAGDLAILSDGPPVGATVVTVGAPLLYGSETLGK